MSNRRRVNISVDPTTYEKLRLLKSQYGFKNSCELVVAFLHILLDRLEDTGSRKYDIPEDDGAYIENMFDELGHVERTPDGTVPVRHNTKKVKVMAKDKDYIKLIHKSRWAHLRKAKLSNNPLCELCQAEGRIEAATEVHHIRPVEEAITYADKQQRMYDVTNLQALCHDCHVKVHTAMGRAGNAATKKRNDEQAKQVIKKFFGDEADDQDRGPVF